MARKHGDRVCRRAETAGGQSDVASGLRPDVEGGHLATRTMRDIFQRLKQSTPYPPGGTPQLYGRQGCPPLRALQEWFDEDQCGQLLADSEAGVTDLADQIVAAGDELDDLLFAQANFPQTILQFRRGAELLDANGNAHLDMVEWTDVAVRL
jgi:hypothetical protein